MFLMFFLSLWCWFETGMFYTKSCEGTFIIIFNRNSYTLLLLLLMTNNQKFGDGVGALIRRTKILDLEEAAL
ncbi:hypothetical protein HanPSC8_Chr17g0778321 [Helianthus annuus]|nr:hypothetical protein HanPSC8_Chr17g0778321 [Helianthus annuus]